MVQAQFINNIVYGILTYPYLHRLLSSLFKMTINPMYFIWLLVFHTLISLTVYHVYPGATDTYHYFLISIHCLQRFLSFVSFLSIFKFCIELASNFFNPYILCILFSMVAIIVAYSTSRNVSNEFIKMATFLDELIKATSAMILTVDFIALFPFLFDTMSQLSLFGVHMSIGTLLLSVTVIFTLVQCYFELFDSNDQSHLNFISILKCLSMNLVTSCFTVFFGITFISFQLGTASEPNVVTFLYNFFIQMTTIFCYGTTSKLVIEYHNNKTSSLFFEPGSTASNSNQGNESTGPSVGPRNNNKPYR